MIRIEIKSADVRTKAGTSKRTGEQWKMNMQQMYIHGFYQDGFPSDAPRPSTIQLDQDNPQPYAVGLYAISDESFFFGDFDRFSLGRLKLVPLVGFVNEAAKQAKEMMPALKSAA